RASRSRPAARTPARCAPSSRRPGPPSRWPRPSRATVPSAPSTGCSTSVPDPETLDARMTDVVAPVMGDPGASGRFGEFGGLFVPETLVPACQELEAAFRAAWADPGFRAELDRLLRDYAGRPSRLTECANLSATLGCRL